MSRESVPPRPTVGVRDIARRLGVSVGTVDRALHDKPGIKAETRARVLAEAKTLGYRPNLAARDLVSRRQRQISVYLPEGPSFFWDTLRDGLREAAAPLAPSLRLVFRTYTPGWTLDGFLARSGPDRVDSGLLVAPDEAMVTELQRHDLRKLDVPVACVANDAPDSPPMPSVYVQPFTVGALAGELMGRFVPGGGPVAIVTASADSRTHLDQLRGFTSSLSMISARSRVVAIIETRADDRDTSRQLRDLLAAHPRLKGVYISTSAALPVLRALGHVGKLAPLAVVATDLSSELIPWIRSGMVAATVYQRPLTQGHMVLKLLHEYLQSKRLPTPHRQAVAPYAVMNSNLDLVLQRLAIARDSTASGDALQAEKTYA